VTFASDKATTETFLSKAPGYIYGRGKIGGATFAALEGRDLFVWNLIPEVYPRRNQRQRNVEAFVKASPIFRELGPGGRKLSRNFLSGIVRDKKMDSGAVLFESARTPIQYTKKRRSRRRGGNSSHSWISSRSAQRP